MYCLRKASKCSKEFNIEGERNARNSKISTDLWRDYVNAAAIRNITLFQVMPFGSAGSKGVIDPQIPYSITRIRSQTATKKWTPPECSARKSVICNHFRNGRLDRIYSHRNLSIISSHSPISLALSLSRFMNINSLFLKYMSIMS